ncbi:hypothetical protein L218DRAFT_908931 [Marasmius fiardii PR-910]|nr:hypothetical protein L218DRAFT_908931 [Marasmius fiardii PR-910]
MASSSTTSRLFAYPSTQSRKKLTPSRLASLHQNISSSLQVYLKSNTTSFDEAITFIRTYAQDAASQTLQGLIWAAQSQSNRGHAQFSNTLTPIEQSIWKFTLFLAEKIASTGGLSVQVLIDLTVVYAATNADRMRKIVSSAFDKKPSAEVEVKEQLVPAFTTLLSTGSAGLGLYGIRKTAHVLKSFLHSSPPNFVHLFAQNECVLALAKAYDDGLAAIARSYGGFSVESLSSPEAVVDDWHCIYISTKIDLIDSFHLIMTALLSPSSTDLETSFALTFALLDLSSSTSSTSDRTPFLNTSLLSDYQHSYNLLGSLQSLSTSQDPRLDILSPTLSSFDAQVAGKGAGALKLILKSNGVPPGIDNRGVGRSGQPVASNGKAKGKARADLPPDDPEIDLKITQVLDILPDHPPMYIRALLPFYDGDAEKVVGALLEGTAPRAEALESSGSSNETGPKPARGEGDDIEEYVKSRRNVFDDQEMDLSKVTIGKQKGDPTGFLNSSEDPELALLKADILRRVEEFSDSDEEKEEPSSLSHIPFAAFVDETDEFVLQENFKVSGDGEEDGSGSDDDDDGDDDDDDNVESQATESQTPEGILERVYIQDPKLFDRDAATRRGKGRENLRTRTGWSNEQIEGWKIMLERDPKKKQALIRKYEFERPQNHLAPAPSTSRGGTGRGGRGSGGNRRGRGGGNNDAHDRAWKEKHKSSRAKRGRDKKVERMGGMS